jgi:hypothetical protein
MEALSAEKLAQMVLNIAKRGCLVGKEGRVNIKNFEAKQTN